MEDVYISIRHDYMNYKRQNNKGEDKRDIKDNYFTDYVAKKLEKLGGALYVITNFFPHDEPLRKTLREKSIEVLSVVYAYRDVVEVQTGLPPRVLALLEELTSLLSMARVSGLISEMNHDILIQECERLRDQLRTQKHVFGPRIEATQLRVGSDEVADQTVRSQDGSKSPKQSENTDKDTASIDLSRDLSLDGPVRIEKRQDDTQKKRRAIILKMLEEKGEITVRDVTDVIKNYSAKTIQRELKSMVRDGLLEKHGKRRWTRYTLPSKR